MGKYVKESGLVAENFEADYINLTASYNLNKIGRGTLSKLRVITSILYKVVKAVSKKHYNLCYMTLTASGPGFYKDFLIILTLKIFRRRIVYHFHNKGISTAAENKLNDFLYRFTFKKARCILLSPLLYYDIQKYVSEDNVFYCPNGIPEYLNVSSVKKHPVQNNKCRFLFLSNMMVEKGVYVLLEACRLLKEKNHSFKCDFVGDWVDISEREFNSYVDKNNLSDVVHAHGVKYGEDKAQFFQNSDVFVFPTFFHNETFGLVNLEAMQFALPVISTPEGGIADVVIDGITGFLVPQRDAQALANKLELLMLSPALQLKMGTAGKERFEKLFTLENFEKNFTSVLKRILNKEAARNTHLVIAKAS